MEKVDRTAEQLLKEYSLNIRYRIDNSFERVAESDDFDVYKHKEIDGFELAIMRNQSIPHYHTNDTYFCFVEDAIITLGGLDTDGVGHVSDKLAIAHQVYPVNSYVLHAAAPKKQGIEVILLIYTPTGDRARKSEYPDDTFKPQKVVWNNRLYN